MKLAQALRFSLSTIFTPRSAIAFVGSGGKTTALFHLARELTRGERPVIVTATTHLHIDQVKLADSHWIVEKPEDMAGLEGDLRGVMLVTGPVNGDRTTGLDKDLLYRLREVCDSHNLPMLIEADGSRQKPLKAPAHHEPVIPEFVGMVVLVAGMTGLGKPLEKEVVYQPESFAHLSGSQVGETISLEALSRVLTHPSGGLKNIPSQARRIVLLNQAETPELQAQGKALAEKLLPQYHSVVIASLKQSLICAVYEHVSGIILAAGGSSRFGQPKPLLDWHGQPFVRAVAQTALTAGLSPVVVVTGANADQVESAIHDLSLTIPCNENWQDGQSTSIKTGLHTLPIETGAAIFLLADQPQITPAVLRALIEEHARTLAPIIAPLVNGQRANPVLFDRLTFPDLMALSGDVGGRAVFSRHTITYLPWYDTDLLGDVDTPEEYRKLVNGE